MTQKRNNILFLVWNLDLGGAERVVVNLCNEIVKNDIDVNIVTIKEGGLLEKLDKRVIIKKFKGNIILSVLYLFYTIINNKYDVLFSTQRGAAAILGIVHLISLSKAKLVIRDPSSNIRVFMSSRNGIKKYIMKRLCKFSYRRADMIIVPAIGVKKDIIRDGVIKNGNNKVVLIHNPASVDEIIGEANKEIGVSLTNDRIKVVSVARLTPKKNMDVLIRSLPIVKEKYTDVQLIIVGDGPEKEGLMKLVDKLGITDSVVFTGRLNNPYPIVKICNLFVLVSQWEGFPNVLVEALALGIPVITTDISGSRDIICSEKYGSLIPVNSVESLAEAIICNLQKKYDAHILVQRAYEFEKSIIARKYIDTMFA
jgi:glycosyltransferase involved in cell wall biosynthesis